MVELVADRGYGGTTVAALATVAGVSKASFYEQFRDKEACFFATYDAALRGAARSVLLGESIAPVGRERLRAGLAAVADLIATERAAATLVLVDGLAAGPVVLNHVRRRFGLLETMVADRLAGETDGHRPPVSVSRGIVRGIAFLAR
ncbi:MAG TPA: helix-turn-helix domain-containing protein, partial [Solirubrobacterales bacterium]|nr:helix-turn-helix domain-containing protein [Solirubrobacterales bacterium]